MVTVQAPLQEGLPHPLGLGGMVCCSKWILLRSLRLLAPWNTFPITKFCFGVLDSFNLGEEEPDTRFIPTFLYLHVLMTYEDEGRDRSRMRFAQYCHCQRYSGPARGTPGDGLEQ